MLKTHSQTTASILHAIHQMDERFGERERQMQERIRTLELRVMHMERKSWRHARGSGSAPITPCSDPSLSTRSSSSGALLTPPAHQPFNKSTNSHSPTHEPPYLNSISPVIEEEGQDLFLPGQ